MSKRAPHVTRHPNYTVLEWWGSRERKLTIYVTRRKMEAIQVWGSDIFNEMRDVLVTGLGHIDALMLWLDGNGDNPEPNWPVI